MEAQFQKKPLGLEIPDPEIYTGWRTLWFTVYICPVCGKRKRSRGQYQFHFLLMSNMKDMDHRRLVKPYYG